MPRRSLALVPDSLLRVRIDEHWSAEDFAILMRSTGDLYCLLGLLESGSLKRMENGRQPFHLDRRSMATRLTKQAGIRPLYVDQVRYGSRGSVDLLGAGKLLEQLKELILGIVDRVQANEARKLEVDAKKLANRKAESDQLFLETQRAEQLKQERTLHEIKVAKNTLELRAKDENLRELNLRNTANEFRFAQSIAKRLARNGLDATEQAQTIRWAGNRIKSLDTLVEASKLTGCDEELRESRTSDDL